MKARNRKTGEIVDIIACSQYVDRNDTDYVSYIDSKGIEHPHEKGLNYYWDFEEVEESKDAINWEQRRYEIAKAAIPGILSNQKQIDDTRRRLINNGYGVCPVSYIVSYLALDCADTLIKKLKVKQND